MNGGMDIIQCSFPNHGFHSSFLSAPHYVRYNELVGIHGKLDPLVHVDLTPEKRVKVKFTYGDLVEVRILVDSISMNDNNCIFVI